MWVAVVVVIGSVLYAIAPWILPARIYEGPYVQMSAPDGVTLIWYTTRPVECRLLVGIRVEEVEVPAESVGRRCRVRLDGLEPDTRYPYRILTDGRVLAEDLAFFTNRLPSQSFSFIVFGDSGRGSREQYSLAAEMTRCRPAADFMLHTGDMVYPDGERHRYEERFFTPYRALLSRITFWPCLGNHDVDDDHRAPAVQEVFETPANGPEGLPEDYNYWFDYANARVVVLDSNADEATLAERIAPWVRRVLSEPGAPHWKFVSFHHPPYTGGKYDPDPHIRRTLVPVFDEVGVDIVFNGHDHNYQRTKPLLGGEIVGPAEGVVYVITGAGGARLYEARGETPEYVAAREHDIHSFTHVSIEGEELTLRQVIADGTILDEFTLAKPVPTVTLDVQTAPVDTQPVEVP